MHVIKFKRIFEKEAMNLFKLYLTMRLWLMCAMYVTSGVTGHETDENLNTLFDSSDIQSLSRQKRYLLYPNGDPARVQLIIGVGLPLSLEDTSATIGYVIKMLYHIPQNASDYSTNLFSSSSLISARSSRDLHDDSEVNASRDHWYKEYAPSDIPRGEREAAGNRITKKAIGNEYSFLQNNDLERSAIYTEGGMLENEDEYKRIMKESEAKTEGRKPKFTRWDIYEVLAQMVEENGLSGRACILRTICEAADTPFTYKSGLMGELVHILLTPSTSTESVSRHSDNEFHAAERLGAASGSDCERLFPECQESLLEMFSEVGFGSMLG